MRPPDRVQSGPDNRRDGRRFRSRRVVGISPLVLGLVLIASDPASPASAQAARESATDSERETAFGGHRELRFELDGARAFLILPKGGGAGEADAASPAGARPWILYAPTLTDHYPNEKDEGWMFERFLARGMAVAGIDIGESYGSPAGRALCDRLHRHLVDDRGFAGQACLLVRSRGGLMLYNWAVEHPDKVRCIAGIYPVCDLRSYPGIEKAAPAYGLTAAELAAEIEAHNPVDRLAPLAKAAVPIFHIHGDSDAVVPLDANSQRLVTNYRALGGPAELVVAEGRGHDMWPGFFQSRELVDFVLRHAFDRHEAPEAADGATSEPAESEKTKDARDPSPTPGRD